MIWRIITDNMEEGSRETFGTYFDSHTAVGLAEKLYKHTDTEKWSIMVVQEVGLPEYKSLVIWENGQETERYIS